MEGDDMCTCSFTSVAGLRTDSISSIHQKTMKGGFHIIRPRRHSAQVAKYLLPLTIPAPNLASAEIVETSSKGLPIAAFETVSDYEQSANRRTY